MNGIDTAIASLLASRVDSLLNIAPGSAAASQTGASGVGTPATAAPAAPVVPPAPQASAQTALSAVALTLNAIVLSGGDATPAVVGQTPIWPAAPALDVAAGTLPLFDAQAAPTSFASSGQTAASVSAASPASSAPAASAASSVPPASAASPVSSAATITSASPAAPLSSLTAASAAANVAAAPVPVAALAAALEQTVAGSGLFYEAHLAQWLSGQFVPADLAGEPQNRLLAAQAQLPLDWSGDANAAAARTSSSGVQQARPGATPTPGGLAGGSAAPRPVPEIQTAQAARFAAGEVLAHSLADLAGQPSRATLPAAGAQPGDTAAQGPQTMAASIHPATIPLVRQQLDLLATGQFRWTGEAWPGARLDWTIQQDGDEWQRSGGGVQTEDDQPWHTRITLSLPTLGTVDAELTLTGTRLVARVQASPRGAARLAAQRDAFRRRLAAAGIDLNGLSIYETGSGAPAAEPGAAAAAQAAASAYARSASGAAAAPGRGGGNPRANRAGAARADDFDWDL